MDGIVKASVMPLPSGVELFIRLLFFAPKITKESGSAPIF